MLRFVVICASIFAAGIAFAQTGPKLKILIEDISSAGEPCGVSLESISGIAGFVLNSARIESAPRDNYIDNTLYISPNVNYSRGMDYCIGNARVQVQGYTIEDLKAEPLRGFRPTSRRTVLCSRGGVRGATRATFASAFIRDIEDLIKECLGELKY
ncbi:MAG: hypothetical protein RLZZ153_416 [Pseudomonadota bacterium]|jgi:hypothetical protein